MEIRFLYVSREYLLAHLAGRDAAPPPGSFRVSAAQLDLYTTWFERPTADELVRASSDRMEVRP
jgi:hypothetical protein